MTNLITTNMTQLKTGDRVVVNNSKDNNPDNDNEGIYIGTTSYGTHIVEHKNGLRYGIHIRPIAPTPEEELTNYLFDKGHRISKPLISDIIEYFNRHKEGEGR